MRAKVEHCFHVIKCLFKHRKTRYRGLAKNNAQLLTLFAFTNLVLAAGSLVDSTPKLSPECSEREKTRSNQPISRLRRQISF